MDKTKRGDIRFRLSPRCWSGFLALCAVLTITSAAQAQAGAQAGAQAEAKTVKVDDFEDATMNWMAFRFGPNPNDFGPDMEAKVGVTDKANQIKTGKGSLYYIYNVAPGSVSLLAMTRPLELAGVQSLRFWLKCDSPSIMGLALREQNGARYQTSFYCPPNQWQPIAVDLSELTLAEDSPDPNGRLDLDQIQGMYLADASGYLVQALGMQQGARVLWMDDFEHSPQPIVATVTPGAVDDGAQLIDSFESGVFRWVPLQLDTTGGQLKARLSDAPLSFGEGAPGKAQPDGGATAGGSKALTTTYKREPGKIQGWLRSLLAGDLKGAASISLVLKTSGDGLFLLSVTEKDSSRYQQLIELKAADGWKKLAYALSDLRLGDDSTDENKALDTAQIKEIALADLTAMLPGGAVNTNTLSLDDVRFVAKE